MATSNIKDKTGNKSTAVVTKSEQLPDFLRKEMGSNLGSEEVHAEDLTIPRIELCQALSKCRKKQDPAYIAGIEEGQMYNSVTREVYGDTVDVIPVYYRKEFLLWRDQALGGGFGGSYQNEDDARAALRSLESPDEWEIIDTAQQFVLIAREDGKMEEAVVAMAKSKARVSRDWNSLIRIAGGPRFSRRYTINGVAAQNSNNQDFHTMKVAQGGFVTEEQFTHAKAVYDLIVTGGTKVDYSDADSVGTNEM